MYDVNNITIFIDLRYKKISADYAVSGYTFEQKNNITYRCISHASGVGFNSNDIITIHGSKKVYQFTYGYCYLFNNFYCSYDIFIKYTIKSPPINLILIE